MAQNENDRDSEASDDAILDRTVIIEASGPHEQPVQRDLYLRRPASEDEYREIVRSASGVYRNPILHAAAQLLLAFVRIKQAPHHDDPSGLRHALGQAVRDFEANAQKLGVAAADTETASYLLCTALDEAASTTAWGRDQVWANQSLLVHHHGEALGGEKCFVKLRELLKDVRGRRHVLELYHVVLGLGFVGRYGVIGGGVDQLGAVRDYIWNELKGIGANPERELSVARRSDSAASQKREPMPLWSIATLLTVGLGALFLILRGLLYFTSGTVVSDMDNLKVPAVATRAAEPVKTTPPAERLTLAMLLGPEIDDGKVNVDDQGARSTVTLASDGLFEAGSADVEPTAEPTLARIAEALAKIPGRIAVYGYTDNSGSYSTNETLSKARAEAVVDLLSASGVLEPSRMSAIGRSSGNPVASNETREGRAKNRRVEILLFVSEKGR